LFFLCVCLPGFVVDPAGPGCIADTSESNVDTCPAHSTPDPTDADFCLCDLGFVVNAAGDGCEEDICATNGYYGDGFFCDDFCPFADPDCG